MKTAIKYKIKKLTTKPTIQVLHVQYGMLNLRTFDQSTTKLLQ